MAQRTLCTGRDVIRGPMRTIASFLLTVGVLAPHPSLAAASEEEELRMTIAVLAMYRCPAAAALVDGATSAERVALYQHVRKDFELRRAWSVQAYGCAANPMQVAQAQAPLAAPAAPPPPPVAAPPEPAVAVAASGAAAAGNAEAGGATQNAGAGQKDGGGASKNESSGTGLPKNAGVDAKPDYLSKNFSLTAGAVVLNPFKLDKIEDPDATRYRLESGNTEANFVVEAGFRRRWAWLDRWPALYADPEARQNRLRMAEVERKLGIERARKAADINPPLIEQLESSRRELGEQWDGLRASWQETRGWDGALRSPTRRPSTPREPNAPPLRPVGFLDEDSEALSVARFLVPDDWTIRLGYAAGASTPSGAAALAGAGDFYIESIFGWNILRFSWSDDPRATPVRGSINYEMLTSWNNDPDLLDIHQRALFGLSSVFGFPMRFGSDESEKPAPIGELVFRAGLVRVEIPEFLDGSSNEVLVEHDVPDFKSKWGFGLDAEFNIPVGDTGSYLTLRGTMNSNFDPNPWTALAGYTVPLDFLGTILRGGSSGSK